MKRGRPELAPFLCPKFAMAQQSERKSAETRDGSSTLFVPELNEHYHSVHGALRESAHVFIKAGLDYLNPQREVRIFEMGFGTGLNALLAFLWAGPKAVRLRYTSVEKYPVKQKEWELLNYTQKIEDPAAEQLFLALHSASWNEAIPLRNGVLHKIKNDLHHYALAENSFDLVFYDAFAPTAQPDLWEKPIFKNLFNGLKPGGVLTTYCARGQVRRDLQEVGFTVEKIPGPPGKRDMTRAQKPDL